MLLLLLAKAERDRFIRLVIAAHRHRITKDEREQLKAIMEKRPELEQEKSAIEWALKEADNDQILELSLRVLLKTATSRQVSEFLNLVKDRPNLASVFESLKAMLEGFSDEVKSGATQKSHKMPAGIREQMRQVIAETRNSRPPFSKK